MLQNSFYTGRFINGWEIILCRRRTQDNREKPDLNLWFGLPGICLVLVLVLSGAPQLQRFILSVNVCFNFNLSKADGTATKMQTRCIYLKITIATTKVSLRMSNVGTVILKHKTKVTHLINIIYSIN